MPTTLVFLASAGLFLAIFVIGLLLFIRHLKNWAEERDVYYGQQISSIRHDINVKQKELFDEVKELLRSNRSLINKVTATKT